MRVDIFYRTVELALSSLTLPGKYMYVTDTEEFCLAKFCSVFSVAYCKLTVCNAWINIFIIL